MRRKQLLSKILIFFMLINSMCFSMVYADNFTSAAIGQPIAADTVLEGRSIKQLRDLWQNYKPLFSGTDIYTDPPVLTAPYHAGGVKRDFLMDGVRLANYARLLAGLPSDLELNDSLTNQAQHGALLLAVSEYSHTPQKPSDMDDTMYKLGYASTSSSNIAAGAADVQTTVKYYLQDFGLSNLNRVGHRRWILNPPLKKVTFGFVKKEDNGYNTYSTMQVFDMSRTSPVDYDTINWPAKGLFPTDLFTRTNPWSVTLNPEKYQQPDLSKIVVRITRVSDQRTWTLDKSNNTVSEDGDYLNVDLNGYGVPNCIIFRPGKLEKLAANDVFQINIQGLRAINGAEKTLSYSTSFFNLIPVDSINFTQKSISGAVGRWVSLQSNISPSDATQKQLVWTSSNPDVAKVDESGNVQFLSPGKAVIKASTLDGTVSAECNAECYVPISRIQLDKQSIRLAAGDTFKPLAVILPENATQRAITWTSSNPLVATVNSDGTVTALAEGYTEIMAVSADNSNIYTRLSCQVYIPLTSMRFTEDNLKLKIGQVKPLILQFTPQNALRGTISFNSSNSSIARVDNWGRVTALYPGTAVITAVAQDSGIKGECRIEVLGAPKLMFLQKVLAVKVGRSTSQPAILSGYLGDVNQKLAWRSNNPAIAIVDQAGIVKGIKAGTTTIQVRTLDNKLFAQFTIKVSK